MKKKVKRFLSWRFYEIVLFFLVFLVISFFYFSDLEKKQMHSDEHSWIYRGIIGFDLYFMKRDFKNPLWQEYFGYDQPKLGEFIYGAFNWGMYGKDTNNVLQKTDFTQGLKENDLRKFWSKGLWWIDYEGENQLSKIPEKWKDAYMIKVKNRYVGVLFGLGVFVWVFLIGRLISGYWVGLISMILLAQNSLVFKEFRFAMVDSILLFFIFGTIYWFMILRSKKFQDKRKRILIVLLCGLFSGSAASVKLNGFMVLILIGLWQVLNYIYALFRGTTERLIKEMKLLGEVMVISVINLLMFYILNPYIWKNPIDKFFSMIIRRVNILKIFRYIFPEESYSSFWESIRAIFGEIVWAGGEYNFFNNRSLQLIDVILFILGLNYLIYFSFKKKDLVVKMFLFFFLGILVIMGNYLTINWERYFLPIMPFIAIIEGIGLVKTFNFVKKIKFIKN